MTLYEALKRALVGKVVRFSNLPEPQQWISEHVVKIETIEFETTEGKFFETVVLGFSLRRLSDNEVLHLYNCPLDTVTIEEIGE